MSDFLRAFVPDHPGEIIDTTGKVLGTHRGLHLYTLGQRRGFGVASPIYKVAYVVVDKRPATNHLVVTLEQPDAPLLHATHCRVTSVTSINAPALWSGPLSARPRYRSPAAPCSIEIIDPTTLDVTFHFPQRALAPGQICAFYRENILLGGGIFSSVTH